jgi:hypothetical protein
VFDRLQRQENASSLVICPAQRTHDQQLFFGFREYYPLTPAGADE